MSVDVRAILRGRTPMNPREAVRAGFGALLGVALCGLLARLFAEGRFSHAPLLVAPIGASAVLVFAAPAAPLAQPRAVLGGNVLSALIGVTVALIIPEPTIAAAVAVALAIVAMALTGCLHPPGGAVALGAVLAAGAGHAESFGYVLVPVGLCSLLLILLGAAYGRLTGHSYPHRVKPPMNVHHTKDTPPAERLGYTSADLDAALSHYGELLDVSPEDLDALFRQVEQEASRRLHSQILCEDIMSRDLIFVDVDQSAYSALAYLQSRELRNAPVLDSQGRVVGMVRRAELLAGRLHTVATVLDPFTHRVKPKTPIEALLPLLSSGAAHEALVVDNDRKLIGIITQTDLLAVLYRAHVVEAVMSAKPLDGLQQ